MKNLFSLYIFLCLQLTFSQEFVISGVLQDENKLPIESATVFVESVKDSSMIAYSISDKNGKFHITGNSKQQSAKFHASFTGLKTYTKEVNLASKFINLKTITLLENNELLNEIVVVADRAPITIKKDTLQFNATSFKTGTDANVEDLLKKLPGIVVDKDGNITVNGKPVNKILVNGKEFFGNDFKIATKNLPKEIIDKIQVVDTKTKDEAFTGEEGDKENKTINITIKEDKNKGFFGRITAGYGTDNRYTTSGMLNYFNDKERISLLGGSNNVNTSGFNNDEVKDIGGGGNNWVRRNGVWQSANPLFGNYNDGVTQTSTAGIHYTNEWEKKKDLNFDYIYNQSDTETGSKSSRETFLPTETFFTQNDNSATRLSKDHNINFEYEIKPDTLTRISIKPNVKRSLGTNYSNSNSSRSNDVNGLINQSATQNDSEFKNTNGNLRLSINRKFKQKGEYISLWMDTDMSNHTSKNTFTSNINYFDGGITADENINQYKIDKSKSTNFNANLRYSRVLKGNWFYTLRLRTALNNSKNSKETFDFDTFTQQYSNINTILTNSFKTDTKNYTPGAGIRYQKDKLSIRLSANYDYIKINNEDVLNHTNTSNSFNNLGYRASIWNRFGKGKSIWASFRKQINVPQVGQLQAIPDNTNPLNTVVGNPNLKASTAHNFNLSYRSNDIKTKSGYSLYGSFSATDNQVVSKSVTDLNTLKRNTTYENVNGFQWYYTSANFHKKYKFDKHSLSLATGLNINGNRNVGFSNAVQYYSKSLSYGPTMSFTYNFNDLIEINPSYNYNFDKTTYSIDLGRATSYTSSSISINLETYWPKWVEFANDFSINHNPNVAAGFTKTAYMWNASLGVKMLKEKGLLKLRVFDLLDQNTSVNRSINQDYLEDTENLVLKQYFMLSFTYKINKFKGNKPQAKGGVYF